MVGLFGAAILVVFLLLFTWLLRTLPNVALGAIIMVAASNRINVTAVRRQYALQRWSGVLAIVTTFGVLLIGLVPGILVAVILPLFYVISRISRPHDAVLARVQGLDGFHDIDAYASPEVTRGLVVYRFDAQLFFANSTCFQERVRTLVANTTEPVRGLLLDAEAMSSIDTTAAEMLLDLVGGLHAQQIVVGVARANAPLRTAFEQTRLARLIGGRALLSVRADRRRGVLARSAQRTSRPTPVAIASGWRFSPMSARKNCLLITWGMHGSALGSRRGREPRRPRESQAWYERSTRG
jgi:SulP family sulfate permease